MPASFGDVQLNAVRPDEVRKGLHGDERVVPRRQNQRGHGDPRDERFGTALVVVVLGALVARQRGGELFIEFDDSPRTSERWRRRRGRCATAGCGPPAGTGSFAK